MIWQRHFTFRHPLFRQATTKSGVQWRQSIYYFWWEFLRRHEGYRETCKNQGKSKYATLYADFGDVYSTDFKAWWTKGDRGARLFAEPAIPITVERLAKGDIESLQSHWDEQSLLVIAVPLFLRKRFIESRITDLLRKHHRRKRGERTIKESKARYPIANQFSIRSLQIALDVYDMKKQNPKLKLWEIAQELRFTSTLNADELGKRGQMAATAIGKKNTMGVAVRRKLDLAEALIDGVGKGIFPNFRG